MRDNIEIIVNAETKFGCVNKVAVHKQTTIDNETLFELFLCNLFEIIKTEALNDFREKKERNYIQISEVE